MAQYFELIVIGSGPAGRRAAVQAAKFKTSVLVVERNKVSWVSGNAQWAFALLTLARHPWRSCLRAGRRLSSVASGCPLEEPKMTDEHRFQPLHFGHLCFRHTLTPQAAPRLGKVGEWAFADLESLELSEQLSACRRREAVARARHINQPVALVVAEDQRVERLRAACSRR
jgi:glycine/D-amino acid oxidase-like deaminating enzyme